MEFSAYDTDIFSELGNYLDIFLQLLKKFTVVLGSKMSE